jgi:hypothetical protein
MIDARSSTIRPFRIFRLFFARFHGLQPTVFFAGSYPRDILTGQFN